MTLTRTERDSLGQVEFKADDLTGIHSYRSRTSFPTIAGRALKDHPHLIRAFGWIKAACAETNAQAGRLPTEIAKAISTAARQVAENHHDDLFAVPLLEGSGGTSLNMAVNEVIANLAQQLLEEDLEDANLRVHPNDHVNCSQSTNDVVPSAVDLALWLRLPDLLKALDGLFESWRRLQHTYREAPRLGRTCLQDAQPMTWGHTFGGWASMVDRHVKLLEEHRAALVCLPLGGTAIGTGFGAPAGFRQKVLDRLSELSGAPVSTPDDPFDAMQFLDHLAALGSQLHHIAGSLWKIANDLIILSSGPDGGLGELKLPVVQQGSSIMPGKINPVMPMLIQQVAFEMAGLNASISMATQHGLLEINHNEAYVGDLLLRGLDLLTQAIVQFDAKCVSGLKVDTARSLDLLMKSSALATAFVPQLGYAATSKMVVEAQQAGTPFAEFAQNVLGLSDSQLVSILQAAIHPENGSELPKK